MFKKLRPKNKQNVDILVVPITPKLKQLISYGYFDINWLKIVVIADEVHFI